MKKVIAIVLTVLVCFVGTTLVQATPNLSGGIGDIMGQGKLPSDPHKIFRMVRVVRPDLLVNDLPALSADAIVIWDTNSDDGVTVTTTTTSYDSRVAGIMATSTQTPDVGQGGFTAIQSIGLRNWGWLQTYGKAEVNVQSDCGTATVKDGLSCGSVSGEACDFLASDSDASANGMAGFFYDTASGGADGAEVFLICD